MTLPNFLIIGAHKAGTTSLHRYLQQHPDVFLPNLKEARFFAYNPDEPPVATSPFGWGPSVHPIRTWDEYRALFAPATSEHAIGEASPCYLNSPYAPRRIREALPGVRLIASLRDPIERAYSEYLMAVRSGKETASFMDVMRQRTGWHGSLTYHEPCRRWLDQFSREQLLVIRAERLQAEPATVLRDIFAFLNVDPAFGVDTSVQFNKGGLPRSKSLHRILSGRHVKLLRPYLPDALRGALRPLRTANLRVGPRLSAEERGELIALFRSHVMRLQDLLGMDLGDWLRVEDLEGRPVATVP